MKLLRLSSLILMLFICSSEPVSGLSMKEYLEYEKESPALLEFYLRGLLNGFLFSNTQLDYENRRPIYCPPGKLALTSANLRQLVADYYSNASPEVKARDFETNGSFDVRALNALIKAFPCK